MPQARMIQTKSRITGCLLAILMLLIPLSAQAISSPGLQFSLEFRPQLVEFPEVFNETDQGLYQIHLKLLQYPKQLAQLEADRDKQLNAIYSDSSLDAVSSKEKIEGIHAELNVKVSEMNKELDELRKAFAFLATERLKLDADPYILLFFAQELYAVRSQAPQALQQETKPVAEPQPVADGDKDVEVAPVKPRSILNGQPSIMISREYNSNYERIIAACEEIGKRFPGFKAMDSVHRLLAAVKMEVGMQKQAIALWRSFVKKYPSSKYLGDAYFRMAEYEFDTPTAFDHYSKAATLYEQALEHYKPGKTYYRILYKLGWSQYLSPDLTEDALATFVKLYKTMKANPPMTHEMLSIKAEILEVIRQIKAGERRAGGKALFGK